MRSGLVVGVLVVVAMNVLAGVIVSSLTEEGIFMLITGVVALAFVVMNDEWSGAVMNGARIDVMDTAVPDTMTGLIIRLFGVGLLSNVDPYVPKALAFSLEFIAVRLEEVSSFCWTMYTCWTVTVLDCSSDDLQAWMPSDQV